jgi:cob(I)alamin adenosyltransferase
VARIYTRTGDSGDTGLIGGRRVSKADARIAAIGAVDELNATLGVARTLGMEFDGLLADIQHRLFSVGASLAALDGSGGVDENQVAKLESAIDAHEAELEPLRNFILPGGTPAAAQLHLARTICRRAEREVVALGREANLNSNTVTYLNRLSDLLFVMARTANARSGVTDVKWNMEEPE